MLHWPGGFAGYARGITLSDSVIHRFFIGFASILGSSPNVGDLSPKRHHGDRHPVRTGTPRRGVARANRRDDRAERFRRRSRAADLLITASWSSAAAAVALFLAGGEASDFGPPGATVTSLGIVAGLIGTDLVLVMLVLAARIPLIDRAVGLDQAVALHRTLGKPALYLLLAHAALLITGYGLTEGINPIAEVIGMFALPDLPLAFLGLGLLIGVVVTSLVAVRRRMRYEFWFVIHLLSYAAVLVAVPHQLSAGLIVDEAKAAGLPSHQIHAERFDW